MRPALFLAMMLAALPVQAAPPSAADKALDGAIARPFEDVGLAKQKVPPGLASIMANPYALQGLRSCAGYRREIARLTGLIGPDVDDPALARQDGKQPVEVLVDGAQWLTGSIIPGQGLIAKISGADAARKRVAAANLAGHIRRAYLKGLASGRRCRA
jgi:hypothetical protein